MTTTLSPAQAIASKVPALTVLFWVIKILATTVGETAADFLNTSLGLGLSGTSLVMGAVLIVALTAQLRATRYVPASYWLVVVLLSIVGTLVTDNLTDTVGLPLWTTTVLFALALAMTFAAWRTTEHSLSIHTIVTFRREGFYWLAVLFTFALGTAGGDLLAEGLSLGYWRSAVLFAAAIIAITCAHLRFGVNAIAAFWSAYILTRPLGASTGDYLSQASDDGGLGLGTVVTSAMFLVCIVAVVGYLTVSRSRRVRE